MTLKYTVGKKIRWGYISLVLRRTQKKAPYLNCKNNSRIRRVGLVYIALFFIYRRNGLITLGSRVSVFRPLDINQNPIVCPFINIYTPPEKRLFFTFS